MLSAIFKAAAVAVLAYFLLFYGLTDVGMLGPDEPRYASVGHEMALFGDWITPNLWGKPWFEKPVLLYWMCAGAFRAGLSMDLAPRLPVALMGLLFLVLFHRCLDWQFGGRAAWYGTAILATSAGWLSFSHLCLTDLPLSASLGAAIVLLLPWLGNGDRWVLVPAGVAIGLAVLAKGLVPLVLLTPVLWFGRRRLTDLVLLFGFAFATAAPWYVLCSLENGRTFVEEFFWRHQFGRFLTSERQHVQPFWFYVPVLAAGFLPWTPVIALTGRRKLYEDVRLRFLASQVLFGLVFFSASTNKLPGYLLPLFPPLAALAGVALAEAKRTRLALVASATLLSVLPVAADILPAALRRGLSDVNLSTISWIALAPVAGLVVLVWWMERAGRRSGAAGALAVAVVACVIYLKWTTFPVLDRTVSARGVWEKIAAESHKVCVTDIHRTWRYGLNYYSLEPLPSCKEEPRPIRIRQAGDGPAYITVQ